MWLLVMLPVCLEKTLDFLAWLFRQVSEPQSCAQSCEVMPMYIVALLLNLMSYCYPPPRQ